MNVLRQPLRAAKLFNLVREIDLAAIKRESEARFLLHVTGAPELAQHLAELLSETPGRHGTHPYLSTAQNAPNATLRIVMQRGGNSPALSQAATLTVCVMGDAALEPGLELPRPGENARVVVSELNAESVRTRVVPALLKVAHPDLFLTLARHLAIFRPAVIRALIDETSRANAVYTASTGVAEIIPVLNIPLNVADTLILTKNQLVMAYKIALAAGRGGKPQELIGEIIGVLGGGLLFRQVARGLVGLIPVWGILPKVAIAYAGTYVIGSATSMWALEGRTTSAAELRGLYRESLARGQALAKRLLPGQKNRETKALPEADYDREAR